ncbi:molybdenum cofactor guanylyltransferase [Rothia nasimurium]|uniref:molybdenum cofactor guanylyltransferase n=1 Tax=Rothia nasimurium TaxID=85336 RepID=UPI001F1D35F6|nr:NTP transferase domain-containing protein [Rothia nasimurium]
MNTPSYSALILAGGRSSRLGGVPKALLSNGDHTLLDGVLAACAGAVARVVVGPAELALPAGVLQTREEPAFGGPAAGISAGLSALKKTNPGFLSSSQHWVLVLSCDLPRVGAAVPLLLEAAASAPEQVTGYWAVAEGITQPLLGVYRAAALAPAFAGDTANASVRRFLSPLEPAELELPAELTADVDTWEAARAAGYTQAPPQP